MTKIILPQSGYKSLIVYKKSDIIYQGTVVFCRRFLSSKIDRTVDQMVQAARSCKQNIVEGSAAAGTSLETQLKLTNVARSSLDELLEDYHDYLKVKNLIEWPMDSQEKTTARKFAREHAEWEDWKPLFESRSAEELCNLMIIVIYQSRYMLFKMLKWQEEDFKANGGIRERMHAARAEARAENWETAVYSQLDLAASPADLEERLAKIIASAQCASQSIQSRRGWA